MKFDNHSSVLIMTRMIFAGELGHFHNHCFVIWNNVDCLSFQIRSKIFQRSYNCKKVKLWHAVLYLVLRKDSASTNDQGQYFAFIFMSEAAKRIKFASASRMNSPPKSRKCSIGYTDNFCLSICSGERCQYFCRIKFLWNPATPRICQIWTCLTWDWDLLLLTSNQPQNIQ